MMTGFKCPSYLSFISHLSPHHYSFAMLLHYYYLIILNILLIFSLPIFSYFSFPLFLLLSFFVPLSLSFLSSSLLPSLPPLTFHVRRCVLHATILNSRAEAYGDMLEGDVIAEMTLHNPQLVKVIDSYSLPCYFSTLIVLFCLLLFFYFFSSCLLFFRLVLIVIIVIIIHLFSSSSSSLFFSFLSDCYCVFEIPLTYYRTLPESRSTLLPLSYSFSFILSLDLMFHIFSYKCFLHIIFYHSPSSFPPTPPSPTGHCSITANTNHRIIPRTCHSICHGIAK